MIFFHNGCPNLIQMQIFCDIFCFDFQPTCEKKVCTFLDEGISRCLKCPPTSQAGTRHVHKMSNYKRAECHRASAFDRCAYTVAWVPLTIPTSFPTSV